MYRESQLCLMNYSLWQKFLHFLFYIKNIYIERESTNEILIYTVTKVIDSEKGVGQLWRKLMDLKENLRKYILLKFPSNSMIHFRVWPLQKK